MLAMLKAIIFDVDGTLAETEEWHRRAFNSAFLMEGLDWFWDRPLYTELLKVTGGKERIRHFLADQGMPPPESAAIDRVHMLKNAVYAEFVAQGMVALRPGMIPLFDEATAAGIRLAICTTTSLANVEALMTAALGPGWRARFPVVVTGDMVTCKKPAPEAYLRALEHLDLAPEAAVAIEDSRNGLIAAREAGLRVVCIRSRYCSADDLSGAVAVLNENQPLLLSQVI